MSFERFYGSSWQHPLLLWAAALIGLALLLRRRRGAPASLWRYALALTGLALLDAWLTATPTSGPLLPGVGALPAAAGFPVALTFVLLGDLRFLLFIESQRGDGRVELTPGGLGRALAWSMGVPLLTIVPSKLAGTGPQALRWIFLAYELSFLVLVLVRLRLAPPAAWNDQAAAGWGRRVSGFVLVYYGLWAGADALILATGLDAGHALRVLPNVLYYGGLPAAMVLAAPAAAGVGAGYWGSKR